MPEMPSEHRVNMKRIDRLIEQHSKLTSYLRYNGLWLNRKRTLRYRKLKRSLERRILATKEQILCGMTWYYDGTSDMHFAVPSVPFAKVLPILYRKHEPKTESWMGSTKR